MGNICITIPKSVRWEDYEKELKEVEDGRCEMNYRVHVLPRDVNPGDKCYVCHDGYVRGWMRISRVGRLDGFECTTTGKEWGGGNYISRTGRFHYLDKPIPMKGW